MRNILRTASSSLAAIAITALSLAITVAQEESYDGFMSGIRANAVKGEVVYQRTDAKFALEPGMKLDEGDFIKSAPDAYAELLLQPGNYLRVGGNTDLQIVNDPHDKIKLKLNRGAINLEILSRENFPSFFNWYEIHELIRVITPGGEVFISGSGIFRINATSAGQTELITRDGQAIIAGQRVKKKRRAVVSAGTATITEIDSRIEDSFDAWSRERANTLVRANKSLKNTSPWSKKQKEGQETVVDLPEDESERSSSPYVVSAKPGAVNFAEAGVELSRASKEWQPLTEKSQLETGDKLRTDVHSFAELAMFPDMHFRLAGSSEVLFEQLSNDSLSIKLLRGSAILDVAQFDRKHLPKITVAGPSTSVVIADSGNYRIDTNEKGDAITIRDGKVVFNGRSVGSCRTIAAGVVSDCDKKQTDNFNYWSQIRGEGEFYGRGSVSMVTYLARLRRQRFRNTGFWFQSHGETFCTFVPFTSQLYRSPYGGNYSTVLAPRRRPMNRIDIMGDRTPRQISGPQIIERRP